jgi:hypothetical protein
MADLSKLKRGRLGAPPPVDEASPNLSAPETAPATPASPTAPATPPATGQGSVGSLDLAAHMAGRLDGRSLRRTNRVVPLALRVTPEFDQRLRAIAARDRLLLAEVLERALGAYERQGPP